MFSYSEKKTNVNTCRKDKVQLTVFTLKILIGKCSYLNPAQLCHLTFKEVSSAFVFSWKLKSDSLVSRSSSLHYSPPLSENYCITPKYTLTNNIYSQVDKTFSRMWKKSDKKVELKKLTFEFNLNKYIYVIYYIKYF